MNSPGCTRTAGAVSASWGVAGRPAATCAEVLMLWCSKYLEREVPPSEMKTGCRWPRLWSHAGEQRCFRPGAKIQQGGSPAAPAAPRRRPATRSAFYTLRYRRHEANAAVSACWCVRADYRIWRLTEHEQNRTCVFTDQTAGAGTGPEQRASSLAARDRDDILLHWDVF